MNERNRTQRLKRDGGSQEGPFCTQGCRRSHRSRPVAVSRDAAGNEPTVCFPTSTKDGPCWGSTPRHRWYGGRALTACSRRAEMSVGCRGHAGPGQAPLLLWGLRKTRRLSKAVGPFPLGSLVGSGPFCRFRSDISNSPISCAILHPRCCPRDAT